MGTKLGLLLAATAACWLLPKQASAQQALVSACTGVSLPRSVIADVVSPIADGIANPLQSALNPLITLVGSLLPGTPAPVNIDVPQLVAGAASGAPITLQVLDINGNLVDPADDCITLSDMFGLSQPAGISIGGNRITGLGSAGQTAIAGHIDAIAMGNNASTGAGATAAIAIGAGANVSAGAAGSIAIGYGTSAANANSVSLGAGSVATSNLLAPAYVPQGVTWVPAAPVGEVSVGSPGAERRITNVAPGSADTDAANVAQLRALMTSWNMRAGLDGQSTADSRVVRYDANSDGGRGNSVTLAGGDPTQPVAVRNVARGTDPTDAVNVAQFDEGLSAARDHFDRQLMDTRAHFDRQISEVRSEAQHAAAIGLAAAAMRFDQRPGKLSFGMGAGAWRGGKAIALGVGYTSADSFMRLNGTAALADNSVGGSAGFTITIN